jgi:hypothetical protein
MNMNYYTINVPCLVGDLFYAIDVTWDEVEPYMCRCAAYTNESIIASNGEQYHFADVGSMFFVGENAYQEAKSALQTIRESQK